MKCVAMVNRKGGVGKSSCVFHLGGALAGRGLRTLVVDVDPQSSLSQGLLGPVEAMGLPSDRTLAELFEDGSRARIADLIADIGRPFLALLPGHERMGDFNVPRPWTTRFEQFILRDALATVADDYDVAILDCPPHIQACAWSAMVAADFVVVPAIMEDFGIQGTAKILDSIEHCRAVANPDLGLAGLLITMFRKTKAHLSYAADLRETFGDQVFRNAVPHAVDLSESVTLRRPIVEWKPRSAAAKAVDLVAEELLVRCGLVPEETCGRIAEGSVA